MPPSQIRASSITCMTSRPEIAPTWYLEAAARTPIQWPHLELIDDACSPSTRAPTGNQDCLRTKKKERKKIRQWRVEVFPPGIEGETRRSLACGRNNVYDMLMQVLIYSIKHNSPTSLQTYYINSEAVHLMFRNYGLFSHVCSVRFTISENQVEIRLAARRSSLMINQSSFVSQCRVQLTRGERFRLPSHPRRNYVTSSRHVVRAIICKALPPSTPSRTDPFHSRSRLLGERVVETRGFPPFPTWWSVSDRSLHVLIIRAAGIKYSANFEKVYVTTAALNRENCRAVEWRVST